MSHVWTPEEDAAWRAVVDAGEPIDHGVPNMNGAEAEEAFTITVDTVEDFADVDEPGAAALIGDGSNALIPEAGDVMVFGDGGAGKTTLMIDAAYHLAAGQPWIGLQVPRALKVLLIEGEGPRALMRAKLRRKLAAWGGKPIEGRVRVLRRPWAKFTFAGEQWRSELARIVDEQQIDIIIAGPLTRIGMDEAGTLQQTRDFMRLVDDVRGRCAQRVAVVLIHHENRAGTVSGAWEGAGDTLLHVREAGPGHTIVFVKKARWSSEHHGTTIKLSWAPGESFEVEDERDFVAEIRAHLGDGRWRTAKEIASPRDKAEPGIGAGVDTVKEELKRNPDIFLERKGNEVGRSANATVYGLTLGPKSDESDHGLAGLQGRLTRPHLTPVGGGGGVRPVPPLDLGLTSEQMLDGTKRARP